MSNAKSAVKQADRIMRVAQTDEEKKRLWTSLTDEEKLIYKSQNGSLTGPIDRSQAQTGEGVSATRRMTEEHATSPNHTSSVERVIDGDRQGEGAQISDVVVEKVGATVAGMEEHHLRVGEGSTTLHPDRYYPPVGSEIATYFEEVLGETGDGGYPTSKANDLISRLVQAVRQSRHFEQLSEQREKKAQQLQTTLDSERIKSAQFADHAKSERERLRSRMEEMEKEAERLREARRTYNQTIDELQHLRLTHEELGRRIDVLQSRVITSALNTQRQTDSSSDTAADAARMAGANEHLRQELQKMTEARDEVQNAYDEMIKANNKIREQVHSDWHGEVQSLQHDKDQWKQKATELQHSLDGFREQSAAMLSAILNTIVTGEDISVEGLQPILHQTDPLFASMDSFQVHPSMHRQFATKGFVGVEIPPVESLTLTELLCLGSGHGLPKHPAFSNDLSLLAWMEENLFKQVRNLEKTDVFVLLSFKLLTTKAKSSTWLARCLSYVQLANLATQYEPKDKEGWSTLVQQLIVNHPSLSSDILGQACLACLAMTLDDPVDSLSLVAVSAYEAFGNGSIDMSTPVPDIMKALAVAADHFAFSERPGLQLIVFRLHDKEAVFANQGGQGWMFSVQPLQFKFRFFNFEGRDEWDIVWGEESKGQQVFFARGNAERSMDSLQTYMSWNHKHDLEASRRLRRRQELHKLAQKSAKVRLWH